MLDYGLKRDRALSGSMMQDAEQAENIVYYECPHVQRLVLAAFNKTCRKTPLQVASVHHGTTYGRQESCATYKS